MDVLQDKSPSGHGLSNLELDSARGFARANKGIAVLNSFTQPTAPLAANLPQGIQFFDYEAVGRAVFPIVTPLVNTIPREDAAGTAMFYREITSINKNKVLPGVSEGKRGAIIDRQTRDKVNKFAGLGYENGATFESVYAAKRVADPRSLARLDTIKALKMAEEPVTLYGNQSYPLGTPTGAVIADGGAVAGATTTGRTLGVHVVALTGEGLALSSVSGGIATSVTRTNADGTTDTMGGGSSQKSAFSANVAITAAHSIVLTCVDVPQAAGYAWFVGTATGTARLAAISTLNTVTLTADESGTAQLASTVTADNSVNALEFNGVFTSAADPTGGGYYASNDGQPLTADGSGNIKEFVAAFYYFFNNFYASPSQIILSPIDAYAVTKILLAGPAAAIYARMLQTSTDIQGGFLVTGVLNPFTNQNVKLTVHPFQPQGHIIFYTDSMPYPIEGLGNIWAFAVRQPYYIIEWPLVTRRNDFGGYVDEGLKCELTFMQGVLKNVKSTL